MIFLLRKMNTAKILQKDFRFFFASEAVKENTGTGILFKKAIFEPTSKPLLLTFPEIS